MTRTPNNRWMSFVGSALLGAAVGLIQGLIEAWWWLAPSRGLIVGPGEVYDFQLLRAARRFLGHAASDSIPWILDVYVGPNLGSRLPILLKVAATYVLVGALAGVCLGLALLLLRRLLPEATKWTRVGPFSAATLLCLTILSNLVAGLSRRSVIELTRPTGFLTVLGLTGAALLLWTWIYRWCEMRSLDTVPGWVRVSGAVLVAAALAIVVVAIGLRPEKGSWSYSNARFPTDELTNRTNLPNVVLISIDSLRADHLGSYGYDRQTSPNIDRLAAEGVLFTQAMSTTSWTLPAHVSLLTGLYPQAHDVLRAREKLADSVPTLAEAMSAQGYATAAFVSAPFLNSSYGMNRGFEHYDDHSVDYENHADSHTGSTSLRIHRAVDQWLRTNTEQPFFLLAHYWDVHYDYTPPPPYDRMFDPDYVGDITSVDFEENPHIAKGMAARDLTHLAALYDGEIAYTDEFIGKLLDLLAELHIDDSTLVVITSDHGDEFFEHGGKGHFRTLFEEVLRVPLIIRFPNRRFSPQRIDEVVSLVDVAPTVLDFIGADSVPPMQGRSLMPLLSGETVSFPTTYASLKEARAAIRSNDHKYIYNFNTGISRLYDLDRDPSEHQNLLEPGTGSPNLESKAAIDALVDWLNVQRRYRRSLPQAPSEANRAIDEDLVQELRALGYLD